MRESERLCHLRHASAHNFPKSAKRCCGDVARTFRKWAVVRVSVAVWLARFEELRPLNAVRSVIRQICKRQVLVAVALRDLDHISRCERRLVSGSSQPAEKRGDFTCAGQF
jgi:hypothetical protein